MLKKIEIPEDVTADSRAGTRVYCACPHRRQQGSLSTMGTALFLVMVGVAVLLDRAPPFLLALYMVASLITFLMYAADKSAARNRGWRIRENTLHLLSLAGGWPGALIAQQKLRHKSRKHSFRSVFRATVLLNCSAFVWLCTPTGAATLRSVMAGVI